MYIDIANRHLMKYRAEEDQSGDSSASPSLSKEELEKLIKENVTTSLKEAVESSLPKPRVETKQEPETDFWDDIINPRVNSKTAQASLAAQAAEDKSDFYTSELWLEDINEFIPGETDEEVKSNKRKIREKLEQTFSNMLKAGKGTFRKDLIKHTIGDFILEQKDKYHDSMSKKKSKRVEAELEKARKGVDISTGNISNFKADDVHNMPWDKVTENFREIVF